MRYDHFHCIFTFIDENGKTQQKEIEGGLSPRDSEEINTMKESLDSELITLEVYNKWLDEFQMATATAWDMPKDATIKKWWVAG